MSDSASAASSAGTFLQPLHSNPRRAINNKPELIDGQLMVGNSLIGSRLLLRQIPQGWTADAAISLVPIETCFQALAAGYDLTLPLTGSHLEVLSHLEKQAADVEFMPEDLQAGRTLIRSIKYSESKGSPRAIIQL